MTTLDHAHRAHRLQPADLRFSARSLLQHCTTPAEVEALVVSLLREIRRHDDQQEAIRVGYAHSIDWDRRLYEAQIDLEHVEIAKAIEREARNPRPQGRQQLTYGGGLRKAARIARGWR